MSKKLILKFEKEQNRKPSESRLYRYIQEQVAIALSEVSRDSQL